MDYNKNQLFLRLLNDIQRTVFLLRYYNELSFEEACEALDLPKELVAKVSSEIDELVYEVYGKRPAKGVYKL